MTERAAAGENAASRDAGDPRVRVPYWRDVLDCPSLRGSVVRSESRLNTKVENAT